MVAGASPGETLSTSVMKGKQISSMMFAPAWLSRLIVHTWRALQALARELAHTNPECCD